MTLPDTNAIIREHLANNTALAALVGDRIYSPRLPENADLPAVGFFTRGGTSNPYIPDMPTPSVQFDCWATDVEVAGVVTSGHILARQVYRALYDALQGIQNTTVTISGTDHLILSAIEEVQGQDLVDIEIPKYFRVLTFFAIMIR
ncbi:hypothetical protein LCGC14_2359820 [marine sediment metagenome]|uniref:DUF3168 domain-containing protein n=1 Tax=marine sediment metagenome TaxID=412755 RepID=A0A0F9CU67_9ZZZZ